jgi:hypothetical protein
MPKKMDHRTICPVYYTVSHFNEIRLEPSLTLVHQNDPPSMNWGSFSKFCCLERIVGMLDMGSR